MSEVRHVQVKIPADLAEWFDANCPFSKQDFAEQCFVLLRVAVLSGAVPHPGIYAAKSALMAVSALTPTETEAEHGPESVRSETPTS